MEDELLKIRGVVSFTFDMTKGRVVVRARNEVTPEALCATINNTKSMSAQQVVKDELGNEAVLSFGKAPAGEPASAKRFPCYLDEDDVLDEDNDKVCPT